jgi:predicted acyl esterase
VPGTRWQRLFLDPTRGGGARSLNDGALRAVAPEAQARDTYPAFTSFAPASDPNTTAAAGAGAFFNAFPFFAQLAIAEPGALTYTSTPLARDVDVVGPASLDVFLASVPGETDIYALLADVWPDATAHTVGIGRLRSSYPDVILASSRVDAEGEIVEPYPDHSVKTPAAPGEMREYHVEFWPVGNRFAAGHRLRLYLVGAPTYALPAPGLNTVSLGGATPSRLLLPVLSGNDLLGALTGP